MLAGLSCCCHATAATGLSTNLRRRQCCTASELWFALILRPSPSTAMAPLRLRATTLAAVLRQTSQPRRDDLCCLPSTRTRPRCCHGCAGRKARWVPWRERAGQDLGQARFICAARCAAVCFAFRATLACVTCCLLPMFAGVLTCGRGPDACHSLRAAFAGGPTLRARSASRRAHRGLTSRLWPAGWLDLVTQSVGNSQCIRHSSCAPLFFFLLARGQRDHTQQDPVLGCSTIPVPWLNVDACVAWPLPLDPTVRDQLAPVLCGRRGCSRLLDHLCQPDESVLHVIVHLRARLEELHPLSIC